MMDFITLGLVILACTVGAYLAYYFFSVVKKPKIVYGDHRMRLLVENHCRMAREQFWPTWWCIEGRLQTALRAMFQPVPKVIYESEYVAMSDGGEVKLDWVHNDDRSTHGPDCRPVVLLLPGLGSNSNGRYVKHFAQLTCEMGYRCVVFNNRGSYDDNIAKTPRLYTAATTDDLHFVVNYVKAKFPKAPFVGAGISLGGNLLIKYLGETGDKSQLDGVITVSVCYDLGASRAMMESFGTNYFLNRPLSQALARKINKNRNLLEKHMDVDFERVKKSTSLGELEIHFISKMLHMDSVDDYYTEAALAKPIQNVRKPLLCLSSTDDPFSSVTSIPMKEVEQSQSTVALVMTSHGGHHGFLDGAAWPKERGYMYSWFEDFVHAVIQQGIDDPL